MYHNTIDVMEINNLMDLQKTEPMLSDDVGFALKITNTKLFELYTNHFDLFWSPREIHTDKDVGQWEKLSKDEQHFLGRVLAFFATADGLVFHNIKLNFESEIQWQEAKFFYGFQGMIENVHSQVYMNLLTAYITDENARREHIDAISSIPQIKKKADWAMSYLDSDRSPFCLRLVAFACVEGIFFSGAFCSIFWLKQQRRGMLDALTFANQLIARDEGLHTDFAVELFKLLKNKPSQPLVHKLVADAVELERQFTLDALNVSLINMNSSLMIQYIEFVADRLLIQLEYQPLFGSTNPFSFMELQSMRVTTNFFESKVAEYALAPQGLVGFDSEF